MNMDYEQMGYFSLFFLITGLSIMFGLMLYDQKKIREKDLNKHEEYFKC